MKKGYVGATALALAFAFTTPAFAQTSTDPSVVVHGQKPVKHPHKWVRGESRHFVVYSDAARPNVETLLTKKEALLAKLRRHLQLKSWLQAWLYVHVPATFALIAALSAHVFSVFFYW